MCKESIFQTTCPLNTLSFGIWSKLTLRKALGCFPSPSTCYCKYLSQASKCSYRKHGLHTLTTVSLCTGTFQGICFGSHTQLFATRVAGRVHTGLCRGEDFPGTSSAKEGAGSLVHLLFGLFLPRTLSCMVNGSPSLQGLHTFISKGAALFCRSFLG